MAPPPPGGWDPGPKSTLGSFLAGWGRLGILLTFRPMFGPQTGSGLWVGDSEGNWC